MAYKPQVGAQMASPNVIPMADIMLVLLIIFMVVTPMLQKNMPVDMARVDNAIELQDADKEAAVVFAVTRDGTISIGKSRIDKNQVTEEVKDSISTRLNKMVYVMADAGAKIGE